MENSTQKHYYGKEYRYALYNKQTGAALGFTSATSAKDAVANFVAAFGRDMGLNWRNVKAERSA